VQTSAGEVAVTLVADAEPRLQNFALTASPRVDKALDDQGQALTTVMGAAPAQANDRLVQRGWVRAGLPAVSGSRQAIVRFKTGEKKATMLKELTGSLTAQALTPTEPLITVDNILKAAGTTSKGKDGGALHVQAVEKQAGGDIQVRLKLENIPGANAFGGPGGMIVIQGGGRIQIRGNVVINGNAVIGGGPANASLPILVDAKGNSYQLVNVPNRSTDINNGQVTNEMTLVFRAHAGQGEPARLVLNGQRDATFQVPFSFKNVALGQ
jgi:hypothetical protein